MGLLIKDIVLSETPPVGHGGSLWLEYHHEDDSFRIMLPVGNGWQPSNIILSKKEITDALGFVPESNSNKVFHISEDSTDEEYPSAKAVYDLIKESMVECVSISIDESTKTLEIVRSSPGE